MPSIYVFRDDVVKMGATFALALSTGWLFFQAGMPAPYLMGSLFGVWFGGALLRPIQPYLGVARWFHIPVILGLAVMIGAAFDQQMLVQITIWWKSLCVMMITTFIVCMTGYQLLTRWRGYDKRLAFFCSLPGGQAEAMILARQMVEKDYVVALFHLVRVTVVFLSTPLLLAFIQGGDAVAASNRTLASMPSIFDLPLYALGLFIFIAVLGLGLALILRLPLPYLLGPMCLSILFHLMGWADLPRINEFVILAQLAIGGAIGARLAKVPFQEVFGYLKDAFITTVLILSLFFIAAIIMAMTEAFNFLELWLAFVPGGLYEVTLLALIFGFDVAFVAFHHTVRIIPLIFAMSFIGKRLPDTKEGPDTKEEPVTKET
jgi:membrane AbrB-like protein